MRENNNVKQDGLPDILSVKQLCEYLQVSRRTVYKLLGEHQIPYCRIGHQYRIQKRDVFQFLNTNDS